MRIQQRCILDDTGGACTAVNTPRVREVAKKRSSLRAAAATAKQRRGKEEEKGTPVASSARHKLQRKKATKGPNASTQPSQTPPAAGCKHEPVTDENSEHYLSISDSCPANLAPSRKRGAVPLGDNNWSSPPNTRPRLHSAETDPVEGKGSAHPLKPLQSTNRQTGKRKPVAVKTRPVSDRQKGSSQSSVATEEMHRSVVKDGLSLALDSSMQTPLNSDFAEDSTQAVALKRSERHRKVSSFLDEHTKCL